MLNFLLVIAIAAWFALLYPIARHNLATETAPYGAPLAFPVVLVATFAMMPLVFVVPREDGSAVLEEGLTASNIVSLAMTGLTGLYLLYRVMLDRRVLLLPFSMPYLPFTLLIVVDGLSALWSIVPSYTAYRTVELAIFFFASILIFDRADIERRLADLLALFIVIWLCAVSPIIVTNLAGGIVFSSAKHNMMPFVCAMLAFVVVFDARSRRRVPYFVLALTGFVIAGSAASTGSLAALAPALLIASPHRSLRVLGGILGTLVFLVFVVLMLGLSEFPALLDLVSTVLQKPADELANATGRGTFWPTFIAATKNHLIGSGYSAGDRFIQLLIPTSDLATALGTNSVYIASSHNMLLTAWAGTGLIGLGFCVMVLGTAMRWGMKLDIGGRRLVLSSVLFLILNGMTTPAIFQDWNAHVLVFVALLAYVRVGVLKRAGVSFALTFRPGTAMVPAPAWRVS